VSLSESQAHLYSKNLRAFKNYSKPSYAGGGDRKILVRVRSGQNYCETYLKKKPKAKRTVGVAQVVDSSNYKPRV
jgi:hypothetical protein